jgi:cell division inhibitor SepF
MASFWQKTLFYLGLVDEDQGDAGEAAPQQQQQQQQQQPAQPPPASGSAVTARPPGGVAGRRIDPPAGKGRTQSPRREHAEAGVYVRHDLPTGDTPYDTGRAPAETAVITARNFSDAQLLADSIRNNRAVVLDLRSTEPEMVRRLVDFTSGLTYALDGRMAKIEQGVILVTPAGVSLSVDEEARLAALGLYATSV